MQTILLISPYWKEEHRWMVSTVKLAELWQRLGYKVIVACMGPNTSVEKVSDTLTIYRAKDIFLPDPWNYGIAFGFFGMVRRALKEENPDIIIANKVLFWSTISLIDLRLRGHKPALITDALVGMTWWPRGRIPQVCAAIYAWTLGWLLLKTAHRISFFHPQSPRILQTLGIAQKSRVIPTGIDPAPYTRTPEKTNSPTITYVGRLESVKGVDDFVAALVPLKKEYPNITIQVVGFYQDGHPLVTEYERDVMFTGLQKDIATILKQTDIFVLPSYSEGLSNALMEAMSSSCACIASNVGGNAYLIENGISGLLFPAGDREALRAHVKRLLDDEHKRLNLANAARQRIEKEFSWDIVGKRYNEFFTTLESEQ